jgi:acetyl esterase/lipase
MKKITYLSIILATLLSSCFSSKKIKDLAYADKGEENLLDIYRPNDTKKLHDVIVFIHGGSWDTGKKDTYWFLGRNFARKGKVFVPINYPLAPAAQYQEMGYDCAKAIKWVKDSISKYGGNPDKIFLMGHSAGGHLAALINQDPRYFAKAGIKNPIKGVILDDPFGLDIDQYLKEQINTGDKYVPGFLQVFTKDEKAWKDASPMLKINNINNPYLMFVGGKTFPAIKSQTPIFEEKMKAANKSVSLEVIKGKKHIGMITQMIFGWNKLYDKIDNFIDRN